MISTSSTIHGGTFCGGARNFLILKREKTQMANALLVFNRKPYFDGAHEDEIAELAQLVKEADNVISF